MINIAILIACHNRKKKTIKCLNNLYNQKYIGNIFLEAMIKGVPIIAGKNSGAVPEIIKNNGILVDVSNIEKIVYGLNKYTQNPNLWKKMRYKAYRYVKNKYNNKKIEKKYLDLFKKTLNNKN